MTYIRSFRPQRLRRRWFESGLLYGMDLKEKHSRPSPSCGCHLQESRGTLDTVCDKCRSSGAEGPGLSMHCIETSIAQTLSKVMHSL